MSRGAVKIREPFNALSHMAGAVLAFFGMMVLVWASWGEVRAWGSFLVFGLTAVLLYSASGFYHWASDDRVWLRRFDHAAIYLLIAGSYTPVALMALPGWLMWGVLGSQWGLAVVGMVVSLTREKAPTALRLTLYLVMGWMILPFSGWVAAGSSWSVLWWMVAGGLFYTVGSVFYASKRPRLWPGVFGFHELWHLFVMAGTACHFGMMGALLAVQV